MIKNTTNKHCTTPRDVPSDGARFQTLKINGVRLNAPDRFIDVLI